MAKIVCFGEVLWDVFPTYKNIGGAPLNVGLRLSSFGNEVIVVSRVGDDDDGRDIRTFLKDRGLTDAYIQTDTTVPTSRVVVRLDAEGTASYDIEYPCAWDRIAYDEDTVRHVREADALIFGSLVARDAIAFQSLKRILDVASFKVFDVNLRPPHYTLETLQAFMSVSNFIKLNDEEMMWLSGQLNFSETELKDQMLRLSERYNAEHICVTRGGAGALLLTGGVFYENKGYRVKVKDTVGAGDSFLGTLIHELLAGNDARNALDKACAVGALVAGSEGANPKLSEAQISAMMADNGL